MSPVDKKCSVDQPIRTKSTESVTDWANRTNPEYGNTRKCKDLMILSDNITYLWLPVGIKTFLSKQNKNKLLMFTPESPTAALKDIQKYSYTNKATKTISHSEGKLEAQIPVDELLMTLLFFLIYAVCLYDV